MESGGGYWSLSKVPSASLLPLTVARNLDITGYRVIDHKDKPSSLMFGAKAEKELN